ncbi:hypothetical protein HanPSC8_Chr03g0083861 [Helianthus annuus]|nr:hypothetical protein HanPSC8_Chr03g0083861 [Helianthus annuus]
MWVVIRMIIFARWCVARVLIRVEGRSEKGEIKGLNSFQKRRPTTELTRRVILA